MNPSTRLHLTAAALCAIAALPSFAQTTATSTPAGFVTLALAANSDTRISTPLTRPPVFTGAVTTPLPGAGIVVTVSGSPAWTGNQFGPVGGVATHYAIFGPAAAAYAAEGKFFAVTTNGSNTLTLDLGGDSLSSVPANAQVQIIPYWTLGTLFPASDAGVSFTATTQQFNQQTQIFIPNNAFAGTDAPAAATYFFFNGAWRLVGGDISVNFGNAVLPPTDSFIVRNKNTATSLVNLGGVEIKKVTTPLATQAGGRQDNYVAIVRPVDVAINDLGLLSNGAFTPTTQLFNKQDELNVYNNLQAAINKPAKATYFYFNGAWRKTGQDISVDFGTDIIPAGEGFVIRKAATAGGTTAFWTNDKTYNP